MIVMSLLPIQTAEIFCSFFGVRLCPPLWKRFRHPYWSQDSTAVSINLASERYYSNFQM